MHTVMIYFSNTEHMQFCTIFYDLRTFPYTSDSSEVSWKFHSLSPSQIIELEEEEPKLFTKTSKKKKKYIYIYIY